MYLINLKRMCYVRFSKRKYLIDYFEKIGLTIIIQTISVSNFHKK